MIWINFNSYNTYNFDDWHIVKIDICVFKSLLIMHIKMMSNKQKPW